MRFAIILVMLLAFPAQAQQACGPRDAIVTRLSDVYKETRQASGIAANGNLVEIFVATSGTWTIMVSRPGGHSCVVAVGNHWEVEPVKRDAL